MQLHSQRRKDGFLKIIHNRFMIYVILHIIFLDLCKIMYYNSADKK